MEIGPCADPSLAGGCSCRVKGGSVSQSPRNEEKRRAYRSSRRSDHHSRRDRHPNVPDGLARVDWNDIQWLREFGTDTYMRILRYRGRDGWTGKDES